MLSRSHADCFLAKDAGCPGACGLRFVGYSEDESAEFGMLAVRREFERRKTGREERIRVAPAVARAAGGSTSTCSSTFSAEVETSERHSMQRTVLPARSYIAGTPAARSAPHNRQAKGAEAQMQAGPVLTLGLHRPVGRGHVFSDVAKHEAVTR